MTDSAFLHRGWGLKDHLAGGTLRCLLKKVAGEGQGFSLPWSKAECTWQSWEGLHISGADEPLRAAPLEIGRAHV